MRHFWQMIVRLCALTLLLSVGTGFAPPAVARRPTRLGAVDAEWTDRRFGAARDQLDAWMERALRIRCPFFRRRATDVVESGGRVLSFVLARHRSLDLTPPRATGPKTLGLSAAAAMAIIAADFVERDYYVTGRLTREIYADGCFFDGPDPDMPVRGLAKFLGAVTKLFAPGSHCELTGIELADGGVVARWRLEGTLALPWRPAIKPFTGSTHYALDPETGLVTRHVEQWDISAFDAFASTAFPGFGEAAAPPAARSPGASLGVRLVDLDMSA